MAIMKTLVDDVLLAIRGEQVPATKKIKVAVPKVAFGGSKSRNFPVDVSDKGEREIGRLRGKAEDEARKAEEKAEDEIRKAREKAEVEVRKAWEPVLSALGQDQAALIAKAEAKRRGGDTADQTDDEIEVDDEGDNESDEALEAATAPDQDYTGSY